MPYEERGIPLIGKDLMFCVSCGEYYSVNSIHEADTTFCCGLHCKCVTKNWQPRFNIHNEYIGYTSDIKGGIKIMTEETKEDY